MIQDQVDARPRCQHREALEQFNWVEEQVGGPVGPPAPESEPHLPLRRQTEPILRDGRPQRVPGHAFEALPLACGHKEAGMEVEAIVARVTAPEGPGLGCRRRVSASADARARPVAECDPALHRRRGDPGQHRRVLRPRVRRFVRLVNGSQPLPFEEAPDVCRDGREHLVDVRRVEIRAGMEAHPRVVL